MIERLEMRMLASKVKNTECDNNSCLMYSHETRKPSYFCFISVETHNVCNILSFFAITRRTRARFSFQRGFSANQVASSFQKWELCESIYLTFIITCKRAQGLETDYEIDPLP